MTGGDRARAEDIVQETLIRAWQHPEAIRAERGPVRPWLYTVAHHLVVDGVRARRARPPEVADALLEQVPTHEDDIDRAVESWAMADALSELRPQHREVLVELYYRGRSVRDAAEVLRIPEGTVKSRTYYALRALRLALDERGLTP